MDIQQRGEYLEQALRRVARWEEDGTLDNVDTLLHFLNAALNSMTPEIVGGLVGSLVEMMELGDQVTQSRMFKAAPAMISAADDAISNPPQAQHGVRHLVQSIRDPDVQSGLQILLHLLRVLGKGMNGKTDTQ
ncbi:DUF1641 domain-containing protein [Alicyclobacillus tolerans]|uniref:DUF1641 domain-containing protein n=1 Tax=Alicyclobacillus tolerans TaxID=90970 RepID=UPI001F25D921|nr:DUF1641 domain-containing protein [Alicyclobacillus tolerans]MCF8565400.1 DUF1641 domain-containing protein [Alicyclobacillus tolerans]